MTLVGDFYGIQGPDIDPSDIPETATDDQLVATVSAAGHRVPALQQAGILRTVAGTYA